MGRERWCLPYTPFVYSDVDAANSPVEISTIAATISSGTPFRTYLLSDVLTGQNLEFKKGELVLYPGDQITISCDNNAATSTDIAVDCNWFEQF